MAKTAEKTLVEYLNPDSMHKNPAFSQAVGLWSIFGGKFNKRRDGPSRMPVLAGAQCAEHKRRRGLDRRRGQADKN